MNPITPILKYYPGCLWYFHKPCNYSGIRPKEIKIATKLTKKSHTTIPTVDISPTLQLSTIPKVKPCGKRKQKMSLFRKSRLRNVD